MIYNLQFWLNVNTRKDVGRTLFWQKRGCNLAFFSVVASSPNLSTFLRYKSTETISNSKTSKLQIKFFNFDVFRT